MILLGSVEPELMAYIALNPSLTNAQVAALDANIKSIKYGSGIVLNAVTANLSIVDGKAFVTNPSVDLRPYLGFKLSFSDGSKALVGYGKAAGTGETLGSNLLAGFDFTSDWAVFDANASITDSNSFATTANSGLWKNIFAQYRLYKSVFARTTTASASDIWNGSDTGRTQISNGNGTFYSTARLNTGLQRNIYIRNAGAGTTDVSTLSLYDVLTPSATGLTIVSTAGGTTYNWASNGGINANAASFTVTITKE